MALFQELAAALSDGAAEVSCARSSNSGTECWCATPDDPETLSALRRAWRRRNRWPEPMREDIASLDRTDVETWERVVETVERLS